MNQNYLEESMRPGQLSRGGFLGTEERLEDVLKADDETVKRLGLTHDKIADRIEYFISAVNYPEREGQLIKGKYLVGGITYRGGQECPWRDAGFMMPDSSMDMFIINQELNEELRFPGAIVHLIRKHHFYEGKGSPYRVDPEKAARVLEIK
jgi:hypothetical protein